MAVFGGRLGVGMDYLSTGGVGGGHGNNDVSKHGAYNDVINNNERGGAVSDERVFSTAAATTHTISIVRLEKLCHCRHI